MHLDPQIVHPRRRLQWLEVETPPSPGTGGCDHRVSPAPCSGSSPSRSAWSSSRASASVQSRTSGSPRNVAGNVVTLPGDRATDIPQIGAYSGTVNLLLVGSDTRNGQKGHYGSNPGSTLNDVNILIHISEDHTKATVISFPRDLYVDRPACKNPSDTSQTLPAATGVKINSVLEYGGLGCVRDTVADLTGMTIPFAALITFDGVVEMSNAVGGVPVCVAKAINDDYTGLHLSAGEHTIKGVTALEFLRTRHGVGDGSDVTRISSQQVFLSSLVRKIKSNATLTDVTKLYGLAVAAIDEHEPVLRPGERRHDGLDRPCGREHPARAVRARAVPDDALRRRARRQRRQREGPHRRRQGRQGPEAREEADRRDLRQRLGRRELVDPDPDPGHDEHPDLVPVDVDVDVDERHRRSAEHGGGSDGRPADLLGGQRPGTR